MKNKYILKIFAVLSVIALLFTASLPAFAEETVTVKTEIAGSDGLLYVRLTAPASSNISTFICYLEFDSDKLSFKEMSFLEDESIINTTKTEYLSSNIIGASTVIAEALTDETKIFTYVFDLADGAEGDCSFRFGGVQATNPAGENINIVLDGAATASLTDLEPLTPDKIQSSFEPTVPTESQTENNKENADKPNIPNTTKKVAAVSAAAVAAVAAIAASAVAIKKKKENE